MTSNSVHISAEGVLRVSLLVIAVLLLLNLASQLALYLLPDFPTRDFLVGLLWVESERSIPTLFSVVLLLGCAAALAMVSQAVRAGAHARVGQWAGLALIFVYLAFDEFLQLHERLIDPVREGFGLGGALYYAWVVPAALAVLVVAVIYARFVLDLPSDIRNLVIAAAAMYVVGAIVFEILATLYVLDGAAEPRPDLVGDQGLGYLPYSMTEEGLEMGGATLFLYAVLRHLRDHLGGARMVLAPRRPSGS